MRNTVIIRIWFAKDAKSFGWVLRLELDDVTITSLPESTTAPQSSTLDL